MKNRICRFLIPLGLMTILLMASACGPETDDIINDLIATKTNTNTPIPTPTLTPTIDVLEQLFQDFLDDAIFPQIDIGDVTITKTVGVGYQVLIDFPRSEDMQKALKDDPYWVMMMTFGDALPPIPELQYFGVGQCQIGCYQVDGLLDCGWFLRQDEIYHPMDIPVRIAVDLQLIIMDYQIPDTCPASPFGIVVRNPTDVDVLGVEEFQPRLNFTYDLNP
jgi:hypothetical protein